ncbi:hypothetical protein [Actinokineospora fastidiosa]|uniref:hypothetical protein n=1 Tax=Actinokineospora fastidiosa TaxID=1816 RepID=UPI001670DAF1|nr:hypothetical protein [Actinokineospora fastidiosa]
MTIAVAASLLFVADALRGNSAYLPSGFLVLGVAVLVLGLCLSLLSVWRPSRRIKATMRKARRHRQGRMVAFQIEDQRWQSHVRALEEKERRERESMRRWYPLRLQSGANRVDIFGGTPDGWASLITTLGASLVSSGQAVLVVDFTEEHVADGLVEFALQQGVQAHHVNFPVDIAPSALLAGLRSDEVVDLVADGVRAPNGEGMDHRSIDSAVVRTVVEQMDQAPTFRRLVEGLGILRRTYASNTEGGSLSSVEVRRLIDHVDVVGHTEQEKNTLQFLTETLGLLAMEDTSSASRHMCGPLWPPTDMTVVTTSARHHGRKELLDRLVFHRLVHDMRSSSAGTARNVVVVAGADQLGGVGLERLAKQARRAGVRLILLLEHLREDIERLLGSSDSATIVMRLGNAKEAARAAEYIGRGHKFVLSQLTKQVGRTFSTGTAESIGTQDGASDSESTNDSTSRSRNLTGNWRLTGRSHSTTSGTSTSTTTSRSRTWQSTGNQSTADTTNHGTTEARVYEFTVEPTQIQGLPVTAYILIETSDHGRRVVMGDCNPGISLLPNVAPTPRR